MAKTHKYISKTISQKKYLTDVLNRLNNDVYPYIDLIRHHIKTRHEGIGNFSLARMIFPIVEAVAIPLDKSPQKLLEEIRVPYPYLCWSIYRDGFTHNDEFIFAEFVENGNTMNAFPNIVLGYEGRIIVHSVHGNEVVISLMKIAEDLREYVERKIQEDDKEIEIIEKIEYFTGTNEIELSSAQKNEVNQIITEIKDLNAPK